jgi:hypothetical protein
MEEAAEAEGSELVFTAGRGNVGLQHAVEEHGCQRVCETPGSVVYRRRVRVSSAVA